MFSVDTEKEAKDLIVLCCSRGRDGYYSESVASYMNSSDYDPNDTDGRIEANNKFVEKLERGYAMLKAAAGR